MSDMYQVLQTTVDELAEKLDHPGLDVEVKKINQKLREARYNHADIKLWADCMLAVLLITKHEGYSVESTFEQLILLAEELKNRDWKKMPDGTYHVM